MRFRVQGFRGSGLGLVGYFQTLLFFLLLMMKRNSKMSIFVGVSSSAGRPLLVFGYLRCSPWEGLV